MRQTIGIILFLACPKLGAQPISLVSDIAPRLNIPYGPGPQELAAVGSTLFFGAEDRANGRELWKSDGTPGGTSLVRDILPGRISSVPRWLTDVGGRLYFVAFDGEHGVGLWKSDGTTVGTVLVKGAGPDFTNPEQLVAVGGRLFLAAFDHSHGLELWTSDGTAAGTVRVKDIRPGTEGSISTEGNAAPYFADVGGTLYFVAEDGITGRELWRSNGTLAGTKRVKDIRPGTAGSEPTELTLMGSTLFFYADDGVTGRELWKSDGTDSGTVPLADLCPGSCGIDDRGYQDRFPGNIAPVGDVLYFKGYSTVFGPTLWKTDGTPAGTVFVKQVGFSNGPEDTHLTAAGGRLYFVADTQTTGKLLWTSDGTDPGTLALALVGSPNRLTAVGTDLFLLTVDMPLEQQRLLKTDGTSDGTVGLGVFSLASPVQFSAAIPGALLFVAHDNVVSGSALWRSDGTGPGTMLVADPHGGLCPSPAGISDVPCGSSSPVNTTDVAGTVYFSTSDQKLWRSGETPSSTIPLADLSADCDNSAYCPDPADFTAIGSRLFFSLSRIGPANGLWTSDGTPAGTVHLVDMGLETAPRTLADLNGTLYFQSGGGPFGLWKSDGTPAGTVFVAPFESSIFAPINPDLLTVAGGLLFMAGSDSAHGFELWKSDGTAAGTVLVRDIRPGAVGSGPGELTAVGSLIYFTADDGVAGRELWRSDGTAAGTLRVKDILPGPGSSFPHGLTTSAGQLFFAARDATTGYEVWRSDGNPAGTQLVKDLRPGSDSSLPGEITDQQASVVFAANDGQAGREPFRSDGSIAGTYALGDINPGPASSHPSGFTFTPARGRVLFSAADATHGLEMWSSQDGPFVVTQLIQDLGPGSASSEGSGLVVSGPRVLLAADGGSVGRELWTLKAVPTSVDLGIAKGTPGTPVMPGDTLVYTLSAVNLSSTPATGVTVTDTLPAGASFVFANPGNPTCQHAGGVVTCSLGPLPPQGNATIQVGVIVNLPTGTLVNTASIAGAEEDPFLGNNTATATTTVSPADLSVFLVDAPDPVAVGGAISYTLVATNNGPAPATGVSATLVLSPGLSFVSAVPPPPVCVNALNVVTCNFGSLAPFASATAFITAGVGPGLLVTADAAVVGAEIDPVLPNNAASATTTVTGLTANELVHGSLETSDLAAVPGPAADQDWYRIAQRPRSSYEVVVDGVSGDLGASGPELRRMAPDGATPLQDSILVGGRSSRALAWENTSGASELEELLEVSSLGCTTGCTASDAYRIRAYETTGRIARFNNAGSQITVLLLQNTTEATVNGTAWFWSGGGTLLASRAFSQGPRDVFLLNTAGVEELQGVSGSITVSSDAPYGGLDGKAVSIEPDTGFTFDSPLLVRER